MPFQEINEEHKQHIALDYKTAMILESDMAAFGVERYSTFINTIITNFYNDAESSLCLSLDKYSNDWNDLLDSFHTDLDENTKNVLIEKMQDKRKKEILETYKLPNKEKSKALKIRLQKDNYDYLVNDDDCQENEYYGENGIGKYLNALLKEYCSKNFIEREKIYAKKAFETIQAALIEAKSEKNTDLLTVEINGNKNKILPVDIVSDPLSMYHYLIGYEIPPNTNKPKKSAKTFSCRISRITDIKKNQKKFHISDREKKELEHELQIKGAQFLSDEAYIFVAKLTDQGEKLFKRVLHLRPNFIKIKQPDPSDIADGYSHLYFLCCTATQADYYFPKFGADAVLEIPSNYKKYIKQYRTEIENKSQFPCTDSNIKNWDDASQKLRQKFAKHFQKAQEAYS